MVFGDVLCHAVASYGRAWGADSCPLVAECYGPARHGVRAAPMTTGHSTGLYGYYSTALTLADAVYVCCYGVVLL